MINKYSLSLLLCLVVSFFGFGQIYSEDFTGQNGKGAIGPGGGNPTVDVSGVTWTIDVANADLSANSDWFQVNNENFQARDLDGAGAYWYSPNINISSYTNVNFSIDAFESGDHENSDEITTEYRINGGAWLQANINGNLTGNFTSAVIQQSGLSGNTLELRVYMINNADSEYLIVDNVIVDGTVSCTPVHTITSFNPTSGPAFTEVIINGTGFSASSTVSFNGINANIISQTSTQMVVEVPDNVSTGSIMVTDGQPCSSQTLTDFTVIDSVNNSCSGSVTSTDLFISEITDSTLGAMSYIEIHNATGGPKSLNGYVLEVLQNGAANISQSGSYSIALDPSFTLQNNETYVVSIGSVGTPDYMDPDANTCDIDIDGNPVGNGELADQVTGNSGINAENNNNDFIRLKRPDGTRIDEFGVYQARRWMESTGITGDRGFNFRRLGTASPLPNPNFDISTYLNEWEENDWTGSGVSSCSGNDYSDIGKFTASSGSTPTASLSNVTLSCNSSVTQLTVSAVEGLPNDGIGLVYIWYFNSPGTNNWEDDFSSIIGYAEVNSSNNALLDILDSNALNGYQFYCEVRENTVDCSTTTKAVKLKIQETSWNGSTWSNGVPDSDINNLKRAILNGAYNTETLPSFSCCSLEINDVGLTIANNKYIEVINQLDVNGTNGRVLVSPQGAFVQRNGDQTYVTADNPELIQVTKTTAPMDIALEYTYWSSPVQGETIGDALADANPGRRFRFSAEDYRDSRDENGNDNTSANGQDDVDDNGLDDYVNDNTGYDWQLVNGGDTMLPGVGYISTHSPTIFNSSPCSTNADPNCRFDYTFNGLFNNGIIQVEIFRNDDEQNDNNWNLIGNPYPSAISADAFLDYNSDISTAANKAITGAIYLWSHDTEANGNVSGNEINNFSQSDYAVINGVGQIGGSEGGDSGNIGSNPSNRMIPSGQSFFVAMSDGMNVTTSSHPKPGATIAKTPVVFNNDMRVLGANDNSQFFRSASKKGKQANRNANDATERLWLNLNSDNGVLSQILIGYKEGATDGLDIAYFDAQRNKAVGAYTEIYTMIPETDKVFAIQGKSPESLTIDEVIPLGFATSINEATLYTLSLDKLEGAFLTSNPIYVKDYILGVTHNLTNSNYSFTSDVGEFNDRFVIVFQEDSLSLSENELDANNLTIIELQDGKVQFSVPTNFEISNIELIDLLGRTVYRFNTNNSHTTIHNLDALSNSAYIARVGLTNGQVLTQKAMKRK